jgi:hypothetical protein
MSDSNNCGQDFEGNLSTYDGVCSYNMTIPPQNTTQGGVVVDLSETTNVLMLGILIFFWLGLAVAGLAFRSFALLSFMWIVGLILGMLVISTSFILCVAFMLISTILFMVRK